MQKPPDWRLGSRRRVLPSSAGLLRFRAGPSAILRLPRVTGAACGGPALYGPGTRRHSIGDALMRAARAELGVFAMVVDAKDEARRVFTNISDL